MLQHHYHLELVTEGAIVIEYADTHFGQAPAGME